MRHLKRLLALLSLTLLALPLAAQPRVIVDTDLGSDCDDAGALAVLHTLADRGEVTLLGVIHSLGNAPYGVGAIDAINTYHGRGYLPLGQNKTGEVAGETHPYCQDLAENLGLYRHDTVDTAPSTTAAYKAILRLQPDASVTVLTIGHPIALLHLMRDPEGAALVEAKVVEWVGMATLMGDGWNFTQNGMVDHLPDLLDLWPTPIRVSWAGRGIITGNRRLPDTPADNPVRRAYELHGDNRLINGRHSWDQIAVLSVVRPELFRTESFGRIHVTDGGEALWDPEVDDAAHHRVTPRLGNEALADLISQLMAPEVGRD